MYQVGIELLYLSLRTRKLGILSTRCTGLRFMLNVGFGIVKDLALGVQGLSFFSACCLGIRSISFASFLFAKKGHVSALQRIFHPPTPPASWHYRWVCTGGTTGKIQYSPFHAVLVSRIYRVLVEGVRPEVG